jgi:hypothetical protein
LIAILSISISSGIRLNKIPIVAVGVLGGTLPRDRHAERS